MRIRPELVWKQALLLARERVLKQAWLLEQEPARKRAWPQERALLLWLRHTRS